LKYLYSEFQKQFNICFIYISEAHAVDVWNIGMSAGTINYKHQTIKDRAYYANKFQKQYDFPIPIYLDNMNDELQNELSAWPFRYYLIKHDPLQGQDQGQDIYRFHFIPNASDAEFDLTDIFQHL
jgi:hypothetical protein